MFNKDSFDGKIKKICILDSDSKITDAFGSSRPELLVRQYNIKPIEIMLTVKGKVLGHPEYRKQVRLKFDDEPPFTVSYAGTTDSSSNTIFLNSTSKILSKFKSSETLVMEPVLSDLNELAGNILRSFEIAVAGKPVRTIVSLS